VLVITAEKADRRYTIPFEIVRDFNDGMYSTSRIRTFGGFTSIATNNVIKFTS